MLFWNLQGYQWPLYCLQETSFWLITIETAIKVCLPQNRIQFFSACSLRSVKMLILTLLNEFFAYF